MLKAIIIKPEATDIKHINTVDKYSFLLVHSVLEKHYISH